jgi:ATPase subunit of ABC transporter with duplicated ATPase domains
LLLFKSRAISVRAGVAVQFGAKPLFSDVSAKFSGGCRYGLIGTNGGGKPTIMKNLRGKLALAAA